MSTEIQTFPFEIIESAAALHVRPNPSDPDKKLTTYGMLARLSDGQVVGRSRAFDAAGNPRYSYSKWNAHVKRADLVPSPDPVEEIDRIADKCKTRWGLHVLEHRPAQTNVERFIDALGADGLAIAKSAGVSVPHHPSFLFHPGLVSYQRVGIDDVRQYFTKHVTGDFGNHEFDPTPLTEEERFLIGMLPTSRQNDSAVQTGRGVIRSKYDHVHAVTVLGPNRRTTLIYTDRLTG